LKISSQYSAKAKTNEPYANRAQMAETHANLGWSGMAIAELYANLG
jgi:hypothetical protein